MTNTEELGPKVQSVDELEKEIAELEAQELEAFKQQEEEPTLEEEAVSEPVAEEEDAPLIKKKKKVDSKEEDTFKKRYGDLRRKQQEDKKAFEARIAELEKKLSEKPTQMPQNAADVKAWVETNPRAAEVIKSLVAEQTGTMSAEMEARLAELRNEQASVSSEIIRSKEMAKILDVHSDFEEVTNSAAFHEWAESAPQSVQDAVYDSLSAKDVIWALDMYKKETKTKSSQKKTAEAVKKGGRSIPDAAREDGRIFESDVEAMTNDEFEKNFEAIQKAQREGKFVLDVSGGSA